MLRRLPPMADDRLLTASGHVEDAAAYLLDADRAILFTTDFFTPVVDDPYTFGQIAAANAFSDVYAMGGRPTLALNIVLFPTRAHRLDEMLAILKGGADKAVEAGCLVVGGHSVDDPEPKYGMAVVGEAHPARLLWKGAARPGDGILLTKPLGTGILATAFKGDELSESDFAEAVQSMRTLNRASAECATAAGLKAATDVTGFGLVGHLLEMCTESGIGAQVRFSDLPFFEPVERLARAGEIPGGTRTNLASVMPSLDADPSLGEHHLLMAADAQTSGGLLLAVPQDRLALLRAEFERRGQRAWPLGSFVDGPPRIQLLP